jgi:hypothetical protein
MGRKSMTTADIVRERALSLARSRAEPEEAVRELLDCCGGRRVAAVKARQQVLAWVDSGPDQQAAMLAIQYLDGLLDRLPV